MSDTLPADTLRAAAERLRELATNATPGPWRNHDTHLGQYGYTATVLSGDGNSTELRAWLPTMSQEPWDKTRNVWADSAYIAAMHPGVGAALAKWLRETDALHEARRCMDGPRDCTCTTGCGWCGDEDWPCSDMRHAQAVAREILGGGLG